MQLLDTATVMDIAISMVMGAMGMDTDMDMVMAMDMAMGLVMGDTTMESVQW